MGLFLNDELRVSGNACRELSRQSNGFVKGIGVERLCATKHCSHRFDGGTHHVVVGVLLGERPARSLAVRAQHQALWVLGVKALHDAAPQQTCGAHFGDFQIEVHAHRPEERQAARKGVHIQA